MDLLQKLFGIGKREGTGGPLTQFNETESTSNEEEIARNAPRRELLQVVMRDTMRKHGIPSDWIECRVLSTVSRTGRAGLHVSFVVRQAHEQLLGYVFAFQASFESELARFETRARDWLLGIGWEFEGHKLTEPMPDSNSWKAAARPARPPLARPGSHDLLMDPTGFAPTDDQLVELPQSDEEIQELQDIQGDLDALFKIRDAAIKDAAQKPAAPADARDFEPTQPPEDSEPPRPKR